MINIKLYFWYYVAMLETIYLGTNKLFMLNWIIIVRKQHLKPFNCMQIELYVFDCNTRNRWTVSK